MEVELGLKEDKGIEPTNLVMEAQHIADRAKIISELDITDKVIG